jgi:hypothetical protein
MAPEALVDLSVELGLFPAFYNHILNSDQKNLPAGFLSGIRHLYILNLKKNTLLECRLLEILKQFNGANVPVMPLKGPYLARSIYGDLALRQTSADLDIMVPEERLLDAKGILESLGYRIDEMKFNKRRRFKREIMFARAEEKTAKFVDLHYGIKDDKVIFELTRHFWEDARTANLDGCPTLTLSDENLLVYLVLAALFDIPTRIKYLRDIHSLITAYGRRLDWGLLVGRSEKFKLTGIVYFALALSRRFFGTELPDEALGKLRPGFLKRNLAAFWLGNSMSRAKKAFSHYIWYYPVISCLMSKDPADFIRIVCKRTFLSMDETLWLEDAGPKTGGGFLYMKRLLKPFLFAVITKSRCHIFPKLKCHI